MEYLFPSFLAVNESSEEDLKSFFLHNRIKILCFRAEITNRSQKHQLTFILVMFHVIIQIISDGMSIHRYTTPESIFCLSFQTFKIWTKQTQKMKNMKTKWFERKKRCLNRSRKKQQLHLRSPNQNGICTNTCVHKHNQLCIENQH